LSSPAGRDRRYGYRSRFHYLTGRHAESSTTFRTSFEAGTGQPFTPQNFRGYRLALLDQADALINIRVGLSESSAFEIAYRTETTIRHDPCATG
jgi:carbamoyl-phosphate synthase large subunit